MDNFDYKKYSLENIEKWVRDALTSGDASSQEIYDTIKKVAEEEYYYFKHYTGKCYDLLALLNGNGYVKEDIEAILGEREYYEGAKLTCDKNDKSSECQKAWNDFWEENYYPEEYSQYSEEELNAMCDKAASDQEKEKCREYNLREAEYYDKRAQLDLSYDEMITAGYTMTDDGFWIPPQKEDKVIKWQLPVKVDGVSGEYYVQFPDDLMEAANIKEDDLVEWVDNKDGSYTLRKVTKSEEKLNGTK